MDGRRPDSAQFINKTCICKTLKDDELREQLAKEPLMKDLYDEIRASRPHLFSSTMVFISQLQLAQMTKLISVIEKVIQSEPFKKLVFEGRDSSSVPQKGVFMGYDFHLSPEGPKLIEINTNAGGGLLNAELVKAQSECCAEVHVNEKIEHDYFEMFVNEWRLSKGDRELRTIAIIDENPEEQYLYPEFLLFKKLFESYGKKCFISSPERIENVNGELLIEGEKIDLIYNRLTDFYFDRYPVLRTSSVVVTPHPSHHALYAHKKNLFYLSSSELLTKLQVSPEDQKVLRDGIPETVEVTSENAEDLWNHRKELFFKPVSGFGSKASYRGDKLTHRVWEEIQRSKYVAQKLIAPSDRAVEVDGVSVSLKVDLRAYVYDGKVQLFAARLYSGQTTNFRTPGGGFAPVVVV